MNSVFLTRERGLLTIVRLATTIAVLVACFGARAAGHLLATDDARDCAFGPNGELLGATGGGLVIVDGGNVRILTALDGLPDTRLDRVWVEGGIVRVESRAGVSEIALRPARVVRVAKNQTPTFSAPTLDRLPPTLPSGAEIRKSAVQEGRRCLATSRGLLVAESAESGASRPVLPPSLASGDVASVVRAGDRLFVGTFDCGLFVATGDGRTRPVREVALGRYINALAWDRRTDALWVGMARGLARCSVSGSISCRRVGDGAAVHALKVLEGGRVVAGGDGGMAVFDPDGRTVRSFGRKQNAPFRAVWALASRGNVLYVGATNGLFSGPFEAFLPHAAGGRPTLLQRSAVITGELPDDWVTALAIDDERLHVGTYSKGVVDFSVRGTRLRRVIADETAGYVNPSGILALGGGRVAVGTMDGLRIGTPGALRTVATLGGDVTGVVAFDGGYFIATRRGLQWWAGE